MATIGNFKKSDNEFTGEIVTLNVQAKNVRIVRETNRTSENDPSRRVLVGRKEIGAASKKRKLCSASCRDAIIINGALGMRSLWRESTPLRSFKGPARFTGSRRSISG